MPPSLPRSKTSVKSARANTRETVPHDPYRDLNLVIEQVSIDALKNYDRNSRTHSNRQIQKIAESVRAFGFVSPLLVDASGTLIAGHGRLAAAELLKRKTVPVVRVEHLDDAQKRALRIADNQLATLSGWDKDLLALEFKDLLEIDLSFDLSLDLGITGFAAADIERLVGSLTEQDDRGGDATSNQDLRRPSVTQLGDLWILGEHRILCGDARHAASYTALLGDERAGMSISAAPYNLQTDGLVTKSDNAGFCMGLGVRTASEFTAFLASFLGHSRAVSRAGAIHFAFMDWRHIGEMLAAGRSAGLDLKNLCVWNKSSVGTGGPGYRSLHELAFMWKDPGAPHIENVRSGKSERNRTNVWNFLDAASPRKDLELRPTPKPVSLIAQAIRDVSERNDIVLDCFSGSGTTIIAAAKTGRRARVIELDPHLIDVAIMRWQDWSGEKALHSGTHLSFASIRERRADPPDPQDRSRAPHGTDIAASDPTSPSLPQLRVRRRTPVVASV